SPLSTHQHTQLLQSRPLPLQSILATITNHQTPRSTMPLRLPHRPTEHSTRNSSPFRYLPTPTRKIHNQMAGTRTRCCF
ncbi:MAG: hypothetical protein M1835_002907, partial [Candelina submexicana]